MTQAGSAHPIQRAPARPLHLAPGSAAESTLAGGATDSYLFDLQAGQYAGLVVDQQGIDVAVTLFAPDARRLRTVDGLSGAHGPEPVPMVAEVSGLYRLEIAAAPGASPGPYTLRVEAVRPASARDRTQVTAEALLAAAEELRRRDDRPSLEAAAARQLEALGLFRSLSAREREAEALSWLGWTHQSLDRYPAALDYYNQALALFRARGAERRTGTTLKNLGLVHQHLGEPEAALACFEEALKINRHLGERWAEAATLNLLGQTRESLGESEKALESYEKALALWRALGKRDEAALTGLSVASVEAALGETDRALDAARQSLAVFAAVNRPRETARALAVIGSAYGRSDRAREALAPLLRARSIQQRIEDRRGEGLTLNDLGWSYIVIGDLQRARECFSQALALFRETQDRPDEAVALAHLGWVEGELGHPREAVDALSRALPVLAGTGDRTIESTALLGLARAHRSLGDLAHARAAVEAGLARVESLRAAAGSTARASFFATKQPFYELYVEILMELHRREPAAGHDARALAASEEARARSLLELLSQSPDDLRRGVDPALLRRESDLAVQVNRADDRRRRLQDQGASPEHLAAADTELRRLLGELDRARDSIRRASPRYAALTQPRPLTLRQIQEQVVDRDTLLLEYALGKERSFLWAVTPGSLTSFELPPRAEIEDAVRRATTLLTAEDRTVAQGDTDLALAALSQTLLGPAAGLLAGKRLLIVGDGALHYLPFAALPLSAGHEVVALPSASALAVLRRELAGRPPAPATLAVVADPVFDAADPRAPRRTGAPPVPQPAVNRLARLPFSGDEAAALLSLVRPADRLAAIGLDASRDTVLSGGLARYRIVHFATHGVLDALHPELSGIALSGVDSEGRPQDSFLRAHEIYRLRLAADLVVLSACRTALGPEIRGEGLVGLTQGFLYAGARSVLVSLWEVDDRATAELMRLFYRGMLRDQLVPAAALRAAQTAVRREPGWDSPYYWAGFVLQGDWRTHQPRRNR